MTIKKTEQLLGFSIVFLCLLNFAGTSKILALAFELISARLVGTRYKRAPVGVTNALFYLSM